MIATFTALLFAHTLADFLFQTNWMVACKHKPQALLTHIAIVLVTAILATGSLHPALFALAGAHLLIDLAKINSPWRGIGPFLTDQAAHLTTLAVVMLWVPDLWLTGLWPGLIGAAGPLALHAMLIVTGVILATRAGGFAISILMEGQGLPVAPGEPGLPRGGKVIGQLERGLIFVLMLAGLPEAIGFLIAAKSILRFGAVAENRAASEYVIIGTLASFGWAITVTLGILALRDLLPPYALSAP